MTTLAPWLDPAGAPPEPPPRAAWSSDARALHDAVDDHIRRSGRPWVHPTEPTVVVDHFGTDAVVDWQEAKGRAALLGERPWSDQPQLYARYGAEDVAELVRVVTGLERASGAVVVDSGMQAVALVLDALLGPGDDAVFLRQVYGKSLQYARWLTDRLGGRVVVVDDGDLASLEASLTARTRLVFAESFTNPLLRVQDLAALAGVVARARSAGNAALRLVVDTTITTPWGFLRPALDQGVDVVVASGTKALGGQDRDLWGYVAARDVGLLNSVMDLVALRGGILDWRRSLAVLGGLEQAERAFHQRCRTATEVASFLAAHPLIEAVFHPSRPDHPDGPARERGYKLTGSLMSFRLLGVDEEGTRHFCDVLAMTVLVRYATSFDGLVSKVNHHRTVSEYFTPEPTLRRSGIERLVRLAPGIEASQDLMACLNWALHRAGAVSRAQIEAWRQGRRAELGL